MVISSRQATNKHRTESTVIIASREWYYHSTLMTSSNGSIVHVTGLVRGIHPSPVDSPHNASDAELWWFLWSAPEQTIEQTIERPVIWNGIALITATLRWQLLNLSPLNAAYMCQWIGSAITENNAGLLSIRPLGTNFSEIRFVIHFHSRKCIWNYRLPKTATILSRGRWVKHTSQLKYREVPHWILYDGRLGFSRL